MPDNYKKASKKSIHQTKVDSLDSLGQDVGEFIQQEGMTIVESLVGDFIERVHDNINSEKNMVTTGKINDITIESSGNEVKVMAHPHLIYQDRGVNGSKVKLYDTPHSYQDKRPPVDVFKQWIKDKKIFLTPLNDKHREYDTRLSPGERVEDRPFKELTDDQLINKAAWAMSTKVFKEGFKPRSIYSKEIPKLVEDLQEQITDFALQSISQQIEINPREGGGKRIIIK